jgi:DNA-binding response OmpR family regulator
VGGEETRPVVGRLGPVELIAKPTQKAGFVFFRLGIEMKVLLVTDSEELCKTIPLVLKVRWPNLTLFRTGEATESLQLIHREQPDIAMLHLDSGPEDCFDLISQIRGFSDVPLVVISQRDDVMDKVRALETGADEWIAQSSVPMEFIAKVNALLRRCRAPSSSCVLSFLDGKLSMDCCTRQVCVLGKAVKLTPIEYKILWQLAQNEGSVVSREALIRGVWGPSYNADPEFLKKHIYRLRSKVEEDPAAPKILLTERGVGYIIASSN